MAASRKNNTLNGKIERYIETYGDSTVGSKKVKYLYENNGTYEEICHIMGIDYNKYRESSYAENTPKKSVFQVFLTKARRFLKRI